MSRQMSPDQTRNLRVDLTKAARTLRSVERTRDAMLDLPCEVQETIALALADAQRDTVTSVQTALQYATAAG